MTVTVSQIVALKPFESCDTDSVERAIARAERRTNRTAWGTKADDGVTALTCHILTLEARVIATGAQARGALISQTVGPVSRTFAAPPVVTFSDAWFASTTYGQEYLDMRSTVFADRVGAL